jgi:hypothetical protein
MSLGSIVFSTSKWILGLWSFGSTREDEPTVKRGSAAFAAAAGLDSELICDSLYDITQANIFVVDEPWKAPVVWLVACFLAIGLFCVHGDQFLACAVSRY